MQHGMTQRTPAQQSTANMMSTLVTQFGPGQYTSPLTGG